MLPTTNAPMNLLSRMQNELNHFFRRSNDEFSALFADDDMLLGTDWMPRIDIKEDDTHYKVTADVPGVDPKDIKVTMENGLLSITGERKSEKEESSKNYHRRECMTGSFQRSFRLPDTADSNKITAKGKNGVLNIEIGKKVAAKPKSIPIQSE